jgi:uncharacterized membrane protein required for colicin V production
MNWVDFVVILLLILGFFSGMKEGAVKTFFSIMAFLITVPLAGKVYPLLATVLSFLPGENWEGFLGFFISFGIIMALLHLIFFLPRKLIGVFWSKGIFFRLTGAALNIIDTMFGLTLLFLVLNTYPIIGGLYNAVNDSSILTSIANSFSFIALMLPETFQGAIVTLSFANFS